MLLKIYKRMLFLLLALLLAVALLLAQVQSTLNVLLPANTITKWVTRTLEREFAAQISIEETRLSIFPRPSVKILKIGFLDRTSGRQWIRADSLEIKLRFIPLFKGNVLPDKIFLKRPVIHLERDSQGKWLFMKFASAPREGEEADEPFPFPDFTIKGVFLKDASVEILDQRSPSKRPYFILQEMDASLKGISRDTPVRLKVKGHFPHKIFELNSFYIKGEVSFAPGPLSLRNLAVDADLSISDMPVEAAAPFLKEFLDLQAVSGKVDMKSHFAFGLDREFGMSGEFILSRFHLMAPRYASQPFIGEEAVLDFSLTRTKEIVNIKHIDLGLGEISIWGHGIWTGDLNGRPWYNLSLHASNLSFERIRGYLPDKVLPAMLVRSLQHAVSTGSLDIPLLEVTKVIGPLAGENLSRDANRISMGIVFHDFGLNMAPEFQPLQSVNGEISVTPEAVRFQDLSGSYGSSLVKVITGTLSKDKSIDTDVKAEARLNLDEVRKLILKCLKSTQEKLFISQFQQTKGYAGFRARLTSTGIEALPFSLEGEVSLFGAGFSFPFSPFVISNIYGGLTFKGSDALPFRLKAKIDQLPTTIEGELHRLFSKAPSLLLKISADPTEKALTKWFPALQNTLKIRGETPKFSLLLNGTPLHMNFDTRLDFTQAGVSIANWMTKKEGVASILGFAGHIEDGEQLIIETGAWDLAGESISLSGRIEGRKDPIVVLGVQSDRLSLPPLERIFPYFMGSPAGSTLSGELIFLYKPVEKGSLKVNGDLLLNQVFFHPRFSHRPFRNIIGTFHFAGREISANGVNCEWGDIPLSFDVNIPRIDSPDPQFLVHAPFLDFRSIVEEIFAPEEEQNKTDENPFTQGRFKAEIHLQKVRYGPVEMQDFQADMILQDGILRIPSFSASGLGGEEKGEGQIDFIAGETPLFQATAEIFGVSTEKYLQLFPHNRTFYTGNISGSISVEGAFYPDLTETARKMTGKAHLLIQSPQEGNYLTYLIKEVGSRVAVIVGKKDEQFRLLEYDKMEGDFEIRDGKFHSTNFYIKGYHKFDVSGLTLDKLVASVPIRIKNHIKVTGNYDFLNPGIDCFISAQPFSKTVKIVKKVPIVNVLTPKDESLHLYFRFKGLTSYMYRDTEEGARLERISLSDLPETLRNYLIEAN